MLGRWTDFLHRVCAASAPERNDKPLPNFRSKGRAFVFIGPLPSASYQPARMPVILIRNATTHDLVEECTDEQLMNLMGYVISRDPEHRSYRQ